MHKRFIGNTGNITALLRRINSQENIHKIVYFHLFTSHYSVENAYFYGIEVLT